MILDNYFAPDPRVYKEAIYLVEKGHDVEILALDKKNVAKDRPVEIMDGIKIKRFFCRTENTTRLMEQNKFIRLFKYFIYLFWSIKFMYQCKSYLKKSSYDYLHCHDLLAAITGVIIKKKQDVFIFDRHENFELMGGNLRRKITKIILKCIYSKSKYIITTSDESYDIIDKKYSDKIVIINNYPNVNCFSNVEKTKSDLLRISFIGAVRTYDELKILFDACIGLEDVVVRIHGSGSRSEDVALLAKSYKNIEVYGEYNGIKEANELYKQSDVTYCVYGDFNKNSVSTFAVKFYESIYTGTVLIVNKNSAMGKLVQKEKIGFCVKWDDIQDVRNAIEYIKNNPQEVQKIKERMLSMRDKYSWESVVKKLDDIYK